MKLGLINSAWAQAGRDTAFGIRMTKEIGFDSIDIFADPLDDADEAERRLIKDECDRAGLPIVSVACVALGLVDFNPSVRRFHLDRSGLTSTWPGSSEAKNLLLVLGEYIWQKEVIPPRRAVDGGGGRASDRSASTPRGSAWRSRWSWSRSPCRCSMTSTAWPGSSTTWPWRTSRRTSTSRTWSWPISRPDWWRSSEGKVAHVHISDCDGQVHGDLPPGRGVVDFAPYLEAIKGLDIDDATISIELEYSPEPDRIVDWVREAYDATAALMRAAGLRS